MADLLPTTLLNRLQLSGVDRPKNVQSSDGSVLALARAGSPYRSRTQDPNPRGEVLDVREVAAHRLDPHTAVGREVAATGNPDRDPLLLVVVGRARAHPMSGPGGSVENGMYGHAERARVAAQRAIAETVELLLCLPSLDQEQLRFIEEFAPEALRDWAS